MVYLANTTAEFMPRMLNRYNAADSRVPRPFNVIGMSAITNSMPQMAQSVTIEMLTPSDRKTRYANTAPMKVLNTVIVAFIAKAER